MEKLKQKWGLKTNWDITAVLLVFAINGSFSAWVAKPVTEFIGLSSETLNPWIYYPIRFLLIFPIYQTTLPIVGWLFGKFDFFWEFEKKFLSLLGLGFLFKNQKKTRS
ncbi:DUF6787 family protein [Tenacibaculum sp. IB213877]|uniref:DUF6787 family protein n=1 Tax=Tenacibaculum sp. IB213877 TaxID=3097351 RepID=UPI002A5A4706|nr:DUF6787 family protein [Tenacibaculum sp. IB213877]MDY0779275.1 DUF6787 family protein [Tenacibaculum sp. IB213877]